MVGIRQRLVRVSPSAASESSQERQYQQRLLVRIMIAQMIAAAIMNVLGTLRDLRTGEPPLELYFLTPFLVIMLGLLWLARRGSYTLPARGMIILIFSIITLVSAIDFLLLIYFLPLTLVVAMLLPEQETLLFVGVCSLVVLIFMVLRDNLLVYHTVLAPFNFILVGLSAVVVYLSHRQRIEQVRQQELQDANASLRASEAVLERRVIERTAALDAERQRTEKLFHFARQMNATSTYTEILAALGDALGRTPFLLALSIFENMDLEQATYSELVALRRANSDEVLPAADRFHLIGMPVPDSDMLHIPDTGQLDDADRRREHAARGIHALLIAIIRIHQRQVGALIFISNQPRAFSEQEIRLIQVGADLMVPAIERKLRYDLQVQIADKMRELDRMKSQFLASMSHELRTPLNAILNFTEFVALELMGPLNERQKDSLNKALTSSRHLLSLINDVLDITKIESGMMSLFIEHDVCPQDELREVANTARSLLVDKPAVQLIEDIPADLPLMSGDRRRIRQILLNLISNACKFTREGSVTLRARVEGDEILFAVSDTGPGIAPEDQNVIFEPFRQTEVGIKHMGGTGLGLPITLRLVQAHGGRLWMDSVLQRGTTFHVALPIKVNTIQ